MTTFGVCSICQAVHRTRSAKDCVKGCIVMAAHHQAGVFGDDCSNMAQCPHFKCDGVGTVPETTNIK